jgi:hypothetical protein
MGTVKKGFVNELRMTDKAQRPAADRVAAWVGQKGFAAWKDIVSFIEKNYPGVFPEDDWIYGGKKHGWGLRYKKNRAFCTLIPERGRTLAVIVLGAEERAKAEAIAETLSSEVREACRNAAVYHDGKWLLIDAGSRQALSDIRKLLFIKRRPSRVP